MKKSFWMSMVLGCATACGPGSVGSVNDGQAEALTGGVTVTIQRGATAATVADTTLGESTPTTADGADIGVRADRDWPTSSGKSTVGLLRFDLSSVAKGSTVSSAALTLNVFNSTTGTGYSLYAAKRAWSESAATWQAAASGVSWGSAGARGAADRGTTVLGTLAPTATGKTTIALNADGVKAVQAWVNDPTTNFGFVVDSASNTDGLQFDSSEAATAANRPALTVSYLPANTVAGLLGTYYADTSFTKQALQRTDSTVNFNWATGSPGSGVPSDKFSARWSGKVVPLYSETYAFTTTSDDGVRLSVNGKQIINNWTDHAATDNSGTIALTAGQAYDLVLEYYENGGQAVSQLAWSSKSQVKQIIPASQLYSTPPGGTPPPPTDDGVFSMIIMPDVQREMWTPAGQDNWHNRVQWIIDHKTTDDIRFVLQVGDLTDTDNCGGADVLNGVCNPALQAFGTYYPAAGGYTHYQFDNANSGLKMFDQAGIPYAITLGNHDAAIVCGGPTCYGHPEWDVPTPAQRNLLRTTNAFNTWFPPARFKNATAQFEPGKSDNMVHIFSAGGLNWLIINLEFLPRQAAVDWAKGVIAAHPHHNVIILTHSYLDGSGNVGTSKEYGDTAPTVVRDELVKAFPNVKFTFSGHVGRSGHHVETGAGGNIVHSFLDCYHDTVNNLLRMVTVDVPNNKITTYVYAPKTNYYEVTSQTYAVQFVH